MKKKISGITIELDADTSKVVKALDQVSKKVGTVGKDIEKVGKNLTTHLTLPIVAAGTTAVSKFAEVDKTMTLTNQTMNNTVNEANLLNKAMSEAAANSVYGMDEAATATLNFARAGLDAEQAASALAPAMNLAAGEGGNLDVVSGGLVATINGFHGSFDEAAHYADVFANACNNSALDIDSLSDSMSIAAPVFSAAGYTVQDAALYMGVMANAGIEASEGANALKTGLARLVSPAKQGQMAMEELGLRTVDAMGNVSYAFVNADGSMKSTIEVQKILHDSFSKLSESEQIAAASAIFGKNQMSKWLALINTAPEDVEALNLALEQEGTTAQMADAMMNGFGGSIERLKSSMDVLMTTLGQLIAQYLTPVIEKVQAAINKFQAMDDETKEHIIKIAGIVAAIGPLLLIIGKLITAVSTIISAVSGVIAILTSLGPVITGVTALLASPIGWIAAIVAAIVALGIIIYKNWDDIKAWAQGVVEKFREVKENVVAKIQELKTEVIAKILELITNTINKFNDLKTKVIKAITELAVKAVQKFTEIKTAITDKVTEAKQKAVDAFTNMKNTISNKVNEIKNSIVNGFKNAVDYIKSLPSEAKKWGSDIINGIIQGIKDKLGALKKEMSNVADTVKSYIHFSEPDVGPLSDFHTYMPDMIKLMTEGINKGIPELENAMANMSQALIPQVAGARSSVQNNSINLSVYGAPGQSVDELADIIQEKINNQIYSEGAVFA